MATYSAGSAEIDITPNLDNFARELRTDLDRIDANYQVRVSADTSEFRREIDTLSAEHRALNMGVNVDTAAAEARIAELTRDRTINVDVDKDKLSSLSGLLGGLGGAAGAAGSAGSALSGIGGSLASAIPSAAGLAAAVAAIGGAAGLAGGAVGGLALGFSGMAAVATPALGAIALGMNGIKQAAQTAAPAFENLKNQVSASFAQSMVPGFQQLSTVITRLTPQMAQLGGSIGIAFSGVAAVLNSNKGELENLVGGAQAFVQTLTPGIMRMTQGLVDFGDAASQQAERFGQAFGSVLGGIGDELGHLAETGQINQIFGQFATVLQSGVAPLLKDVVQTLANLASAVMPALGPMLASLGSTLTAISGPLGQLGASFANALTPLLPALGQVISALANGLAPILPIISNALQPLGPILAQSLGIAAPVIQKLVQGLGQLLDAVAPLLPPLLQLVSAILTPLIGVFQSIFAALAPVIQQLAGQLQPIIQQLTPFFQQLGQVYGKILAQVFQQIGQALLQLLPVFTQVAATLMPVLLKAVQQMAPFLPQLVGAFLQLVPPILMLIPPLAQLVAAILPLWIQHQAQLMQGVVLLIGVLTKIASVIITVLAVAFNIIVTVIKTVISWVTNLGGTWNTIMNGIKEAVSEVAKWVGDRFNDIVNFFKKMGSDVAGLATGIWNNVKNIFQNGVNKVVEVVGNISSAVGRVFSKAATWLYDAGKDMIQGLINGIKDMAQNVLSTLESAVGGPIKFFKEDILQIHSPSLLFKSMGEMVVEGFAVGITGSQSRAVDAATGLGQSTIKGAAQGAGVKTTGNGVIRGPGTGTSDSILGVDAAGVATARVSNGEFVVNAAATAKHLPLLQAINSGLIGLAGGGVVRSADDIDSFPRREGLEGAPYIWDGTHWGDCSGAMSAIARFAVGLDPWGGRFSTGNEASALTSMGFKIGMGGAGDLRISWYNGGEGGGHTAGTLPDGTRVEMGGQRGNGQVGGNAAGADNPEFTDHAFLKVVPPHLAGLDDPQGDITGNTAFNPAMPGTSGMGTSMGNTAGTLSSTGLGTTGTQSPTSWSQVAGIAASAAATGYVSDLLKTFGLQDDMPPAVQAYNQYQQAIDQKQKKAQPGTAIMGATAPTDPGTSSAGAAGDPMSAPPANESFNTTMNLNTANHIGEDPVPNHVYNPSGGAEQWRSTVQAVYQAAAWPLSWVDYAIKQINTESTGNPRAINNYDSNAAAGHPSKGLMQVIDPTFQRFRSPKYPNDIWNPAANIYAGTNDAKSTYGDPTKVWGQGHGYAAGGFVSGAGGPTSDSIAAWLSDGEFVMNASATAQHRPVLEAMNSGKPIQGSHGPVTTFNISTARVEDAFYLAKQQSDRQAAAYVSRW